MPDDLLPLDGEALLVLDAVAKDDAYQLAGLTRAVVGEGRPAWSARLTVTPYAWDQTTDAAGRRDQPGPIPLAISRLR